ncbi:zinc finger protein 665-like isoform X1 [Macrosteles quadrilineatus]|uniref:zinc finger protein 665-like isoform X1 n=1 Tax=Macrosteles quadrilineatus TaxID=74068 RepID=UPI0023E09A7A|nr:zinc finger protein 665-like isoform X1 [Macrosteles quadrilineatus]
MPDSAENNVACRICMNPKDQYVSLFLNDLSRKVMELADVQVEKEDGLPENICAECEKELEKCYEFRLKVQVADKKFRKCLGLKFAQVDLEEHKIKEENYINEDSSDNEDDTHSVCMDEENEHEPEDSQRISEETEEATPDPLNHVQVVQENEKAVEMAEDPIAHTDLMVKQPQITLPKIEEVSVDQFACMKQESEVDIMDIDCNQPDPFGPSSSVGIPVLAGTFFCRPTSDLNSRGHNIDNQMGVMAEQNQQVSGCYEQFTTEKTHSHLPQAVNQPERISSQGKYFSSNQQVSEFPVRFPTEQTYSNLSQVMNPPESRSLIYPLQRYFSSFHNFDSFPQTRTQLDCAILPSAVAYPNTLTLSAIETTSPDNQSTVTSSCGNIESENTAIPNTKKFRSGNENNTSTDSIDNNQDIPPQPILDKEPEGFCLVCSVDCGTTELLDEHKAGNYFVCRNCSLTFKNHNELENHFYSHKTCLCVNCKKPFYCKSDLHRHKKTNSLCKGQRTHKGYKCRFCSRKYVKKLSLDQHIRQMHPNGESTTYPCIVCKKIYKSSSDYNNHMRATHMVYISLECEICHIIEPGPLQLKNHVQNTHVKGSQCCPICSKTFANENHLPVHMELHFGKEIECETCGKILKGKNAYYSHQMNHKGRLYTCSVCKMTFKNKSERNKHCKLVHNIGKLNPASAPVICEECGKSYKSARILKFHKMSVHSDEKNFVCHICGAAFKVEVALRTHSRIHSDVNKYSCEKCGKGFRWKQTFDKHMLKCESSNAACSDSRSE